MKKPALLTLVFALAVSAPSHAATIIVVRHAERAAREMSDDVPLNAAGEARAKQLARMLKDSGVTRVFTTELQRTRQTAAPLAEGLGITPTVVPAKDVVGLVRLLRALRTNDVAFVVGHSNTVPAIVQRITGVTPPQIADTEYDRLLVIQTAGKPKVLTLRYGAE